MCVRQAVYQQLFSIHARLTLVSQALCLFNSTSQHSTSYGSGTTSSQAVPARCLGATLGCEISDNISHEISDIISHGISDEIWCKISRQNSKWAFRPAKQGVWKIRLGNPLLFAGYLLPKPRRCCANPICCGPLNMAGMLRITQTKWHLVSKWLPVCPVDMSNKSSLVLTLVALSGVLLRIRAPQLRDRKAERRRSVPAWDMGTELKPCYPKWWVCLCMSWGVSQVQKF